MSRTTAPIVARHRQPNPPIPDILAMPTSAPRPTDMHPAEGVLLQAALQNAIFNSVNFSKIATDARGVIQIFNVGAERMLGYTAAEVKNKVTPADISDPLELIGRATALSLELDTLIAPGFEALVFKASRGIEDVYELTYIRKDGSRLPAVVSVTALRDVHETIIGYLLIGTEIKSGALQSAIFNSANFSSIATDARGVIQIFNVGAERMLGYAAAEVMNRITPADLSDPDELVLRANALSGEFARSIAPGFEALVYKAARGIEDIYELTYVRKDGSRLPAVVSVTALRDAQDIIIGYLLIGTDNTARKLVEARQKQSEQRLRDQQFYTRSLIESNIDALMTTDPAGIITDVNKQMEALTSCTRDELIGAPFKDLFTDPDRAEAGIQRALRERSVTDYELTTLGRNGKMTVVSYNATTFYNRSRSLQGVFASVRDITRIKEAESTRELLLTQLTESNSELERFAYVASHDMQEPLRMMINFSQVISRDYADRLDDDGKTYLKMIGDSASRMRDMVHDLLEYARLGHEGFKFTEVDMDLEWSHVMENLGQLRYETGAIITCDSLPKVRGSAVQLMRLLQNLIANAIKFQPANQVPVIHIGVTDEGGRRVFSVKDNGLGIEPAFIGEIFEPFRRLHAWGAIKGTGLGLAVCKKIVENHGGRIWASSSPGTGTTMLFTLPEGEPS